MSLIIHDQSLFVKNSDTNEFIPISMFSSGADQALNQIAEAAQAAKDGVDDAINEKMTQVLSTVDSTVTTKVNQALLDADTKINNKIDEVLADTNYGQLSSEVDGLSEDLSELDSRLSESIADIEDKTFSYGLQKKIYTQTIMSGYYAEVAANVVALKTSSTLDTIYFFADKELSVYFDEIPSNAYFSVCVGKKPYSHDWQQTSFGYQIQNVNGASRVRKSDNNLPTASNKLIIPSDSLVCITVTKGTDAFLCFDGYDYTHLNPNIVIDAEPKKETIKLKRVSVNGWTHIRMGNMRFYMSVYSMSGANVNVFRFRQCHLMDTESEIMLVWDSDEDAEGVIKLLGETDFIGGYHGSEQMTSYYIIADGNVVSNTSVLDLEASNITIIVESNVYHCWRDASVKDTIAFKRTKKIVFEDNSVSVSNHWMSVGTNKVISAPLMLFQTKFGDNQVQKYTDNTDCKLWDVPKTSDALLPTMSKDLTQFSVFLPNTTVRMDAVRGQNNEHYRGYVANFYSSNRVKFYMNYIYNVLTGVEYADGASLNTEFKLTFK